MHVVHVQRCQNHVAEDDARDTPLFMIEWGLDISLDATTGTWLGASLQIRRLQLAAGPVASPSSSTTPMLVSSSNATPHRLSTPRPLCGNTAQFRQRQRQFQQEAFLQCGFEAEVCEELW